MDSKDLIPSSLDQFNTSKVVVFKEVAPLSDKFEQVMFTKKQSAAINRFILLQMTKAEETCDCGAKHPQCYIVVTDDSKPPYTFSDIPMFYPDKVIEAELKNAK